MYDFGDIRSRNPRVYAVNNNTFLRRYSKNRHITSNISEYPGPMSTYFTGLVGVLVVMNIPIFVWRSPKGRCYGNQSPCTAAQATTVRPKCRSPTRLLGTEVGACLSSSPRAPLAVHSGTDQLPLCRYGISLSERYGATVPGQSAPSSFRHRRAQTAALRLDVNAAGPAFVALNDR